MYYLRPDKDGICEVIEFQNNGETVLLKYPEGGFGYWPIDVLIKVEA